MASTTYRVIQEQPQRGLFSKAQIDEAIRAANAILARREAKTKTRSSAKKPSAHPRN